MDPTEARLTFHIEYDMTTKDGIGLSLIRRDDKGGEERFTAWMTPGIAAHYAETLLDLARRAGDYLTEKS